MFFMQDSSCSKLWIQDLEAPVFASISINCSNGNGMFNYTLLTLFCILLDQYMQVKKKLYTHRSSEIRK